MSKFIIKPAMPSGIAGFSMMFGCGEGCALRAGGRLKTEDLKLKNEELWCAEGTDWMDNPSVKPQAA
ncbi:MAG: hypothetical protein IKM36_05060 [Oscillospiraceae bacterium]|nr:hypothetical protein [Oscillospiraceae bacterium]